MFAGFCLSHMRIKPSRYKTLSFSTKDTSEVSVTLEEVKKRSPKKAELTKEEKLKLRRAETDISNDELFSFLKFVNLNQLNQDERLIHEKHVEALKVKTVIL